MQSSFTLNVKVYLPIGIPDGTEDLTINTGITLAPQFISVNPKIGSAAGSLIVATVKGVGPNTPNVTLVTSNGTSICDSV